MRGLIFTTAALALFLAVFAELSSAEEESYFKKTLDTLQGVSADIYNKASETITQVQDSAVGQHAKSWIETGTGFVRNVYDTIADKAQEKWEAFTA
ncbi:apolipoprotein C-III [Ambystoma mexicanum]|uniref:apolipoprotein C-III n=1 Tax=Ambystoma mexicanum TaxID=8296 RepID=UPI0037E9A2BF